MLRAADIMKPAGAFRATWGGFFGAAALDRQRIDRNGGFDMVFHFPERETANMRRVVREYLRKMALPARGASWILLTPLVRLDLCLGAACTGCIPGS